MLDLREDYRGGKSIGEYVPQRDTRAVDRVPNLWYRVGEQECLNLLVSVTQRMSSSYKQANKFPSEDL